jgi:hypothetical protein
LILEQNKLDRLFLERLFAWPDSFASCREPTLTLNAKANIKNNTNLDSEKHSSLFQPSTFGIEKMLQQNCKTLSTFTCSFM